MIDDDFAGRLDSSLAGWAAAWMVALPQEPVALDDASVLLSPAEHARADRFRAPADRADYILGHAALRILLEARLGRSLAGQAFDLQEHGKPHLAGQPLGFNFSRARGTAAVGIIDNGAIGIDVEAIVPDGSNLEIARAHFSNAERAWIEGSLDADERIRRFYRLWVAREALAKAGGEGLGRPLTEVLDIEGDVPALATESRWQLREAPVMAGYAAAVVVPRGRPVTWRDTTWNALARWRGGQPYSRPRA